MAHRFKGHGLLSKQPQVSSQKDHSSKNGDCSKFITTGTFFGIYVKTKLSKTTQIMLSQKLGETMVYQYSKS